MDTAFDITTIELLPELHPVSSLAIKEVGWCKYSGLWEHFWKAKAVVLHHELSPAVEAMVLNEVADWIGLD